MYNYCSFLAFIRVTPLDINDHHWVFSIHWIPNAFGSLPYPFLTIELFKPSLKKRVQKSGFTRTLWANNRKNVVGLFQGFDMLLVKSFKLFDSEWMSKLPKCGLVVNELMFFFDGH